MLTPKQFDRLQTLIKASSRAWQCAADTALYSSGVSRKLVHRHRRAIRQGVKTSYAIARLARKQREREREREACKACKGSGQTSCIAPNCRICPEPCRVCCNYQTLIANPIHRSM